MDALVTFLTSLAGLAKEVSLFRLLTMALTGAVGILLMQLFDSRAAIFTALLSAPTLTVGLLVGATVLVVVIGWLFAVIVRRMDKNAGKYEKSLNDRIDQLVQQVHEVEQREKECTERFNALLIKLNVSL